MFHPTPHDSFLCIGISAHFGRSIFLAKDFGSGNTYSQLDIVPIKKHHFAFTRFEHNVFFWNIFLSLCQIFSLFTPLGVGPGDRQTSDDREDSARSARLFAFAPDAQRTILNLLIGFEKNRQCCIFSGMRYVSWPRVFHFTPGERLKYLFRLSYVFTKYVVVYIYMYIQSSDLLPFSQQRSTKFVVTHPATNLIKLELYFHTSHLYS